MNKEVFLNKLLVENIFPFLQEVTGCKLGTKQCAVPDASIGNKISFHVVIKSIYLPTLAEWHAFGSCLEPSLAKPPALHLCPYLTLWCMATG